MSKRQDIALRAVADGLNAGATALSDHGNPFSDSYAGPIDSWIKPERAQEVRELLDDARCRTPDYMRGVLIPPAALAEIRNLLDSIESDLRWGAKFQHCVNGDTKAAEAQMAGILSSLLKA